MAEQRNIIVVGASYSGLSAAHYIAKHTLPKLQSYKEATYALHVIDPSTHWWHNIGAPREIVSTKDATHEKYFLPIKDAFTQYTSLKDVIHFHQASVTGVDTSARTVTLSGPEGSTVPETLPYYALVIATGNTSPTPLTTKHGDHTKSTKALDEMNLKLKTAKEVVIGGGGPVGVETAGEIAYYYKNAHVTIVTSSDKLIPVFKKSRADKVQKLLEKAGVTVLFNTRVESADLAADGTTSVKLSDGKTLAAEVYIPAGGLKPNTDFLSAELKTEKGYVKANPTTFRVDAAGPRVYAVGDVAGADNGGMLRMYAAIPVWGANFNHDVLGEAKVATVAEKTYTPQNPETQFVPVGPKAGVAAFNGWGIPGFIVSQVKGKDYMLGMTKPEIYDGKKWLKA